MTGVLGWLMSDLKFDPLAKSGSLGFPRDDNLAKSEERSPSAHPPGSGPPPRNSKAKRRSLGFALREHVDALGLRGTIVTQATNS
jgi:hypothetical protein